MTDYHGEECTGFIRQVRRKAFEAGKSRDKEWMADYAESCFADDAEVVLMEEYCKYRVSSVEGSGTILAAAPPDAPRVTLPTNASEMIGFVRIVAETLEAGNYISKKVDPHLWSISRKDFPEPYCWLGIRLSDNNQIGPRRWFGNLSLIILSVLAIPVQRQHQRLKLLEHRPRVPKDQHEATFGFSSHWTRPLLTRGVTQTIPTFCNPLVNLENKGILAVSNWSKFTKVNSDRKYAKALHAVN
ncbi:hypothetical protein M407DRAFT_6575 [Tulasnella calospora MUT 4182]|uniref:Uncharacterized protein n=1 Tax=Tulasnella calospora MUT 4182 TaxID=1051891 RepID=A0A0C3L4S6_9AGAM|nr:hypothetical protein M407DRAFT_6575 [Tulasnella calospora MUT 4182]